MEEMSFNFQLEPQHRDYKTRNILTWEERIQVIQAYDRTPVYQRIAEQFNCSSKQIKNIIANRKSLLLYHSNSQLDSKTQEARRRRHQKILFLGKVIYEYILRAVYHNIEIDGNTVRQKAMQIKESIAIENFFPNAAWLQNFKVRYQIPEYDTSTLRKTIKFHGPKSASLNAIDIIQYVSKQERLERTLKQISESNNGNNQNDHSEMELSSENSHINNNKNDSVNLYIMVDDNDDRSSTPSTDAEHAKNTESPIVCLDSDDDTNANDQDDGDDNDNDTNEQRMQVSPSVDQVALHDITSFREALLHLKALQDFAMLQDNYRAIGLITQLEEVFKNPPKFNDFDDSV